MIVATVSAVVVLAVAGWVWTRSRRTLTTPAERAVHEALRMAAAAADPLRAGLDERSAGAAAPQLRRLIGAAGVAIADPDGTVLAWSGGGRELGAAFQAAAAQAAGTGPAVDRRVLVVRKPGPGALIVQPLLADASGSLGVLGVVTDVSPGPGLLGVVQQVADYVCGQLELAELDASRTRLDRAEIRMLRAQISPHFIYNALTTIASFVRTDPSRARELILEVADFTRYSFRTAGEFTVLADELRNIDRYLALERARFGAALRVRVQVAPETLSVVLPFLALQPLVENAVRHGLAGRASGTVTILAADEGADCVLSIEDDGVGMDPALLRSGEIDAVDSSGPTSTGELAHVGLANVDDRMRAAFGDEYGLVVETALGAGTKVIMRVPKFRPGVRT